MKFFDRTHPNSLLLRLIVVLKGHPFALRNFKHCSIWQICYVAQLSTCQSQGRCILHIKSIWISVRSQIVCWEQFISFLSSKFQNLEIFSIQKANKFRFNNYKLILRSNTQYYEIQACSICCSMNLANDFAYEKPEWLRSESPTISPAKWCSLLPC